MFSLYAQFERKQTVQVLLSSWLFKFVTVLNGAALTKLDKHSYVSLLFLVSSESTDYPETTRDWEIVNIVSFKCQPLNPLDNWFHCGLVWSLFRRLLFLNRMEYLLSMILYDCIWGMPCCWCLVSCYPSHCQSRRKNHGDFGCNLQANCQS